MGINKNFSRQIKRVERIPQRALYRQTRVMFRGMEKKAMKGMTQSPRKFNKRKFAREFIWFFASVLIAFVLSFLIFYLSTHFFESLIEIGIRATGSVYYLFYVLVFVCFTGIYISRIISWAIHVSSTPK